MVITPKRGSYRNQALRTETATTANINSILLKDIRKVKHRRKKMLRRKINPCSLKAKDKGNEDQRKDVEIPESLSFTEEEEETSSSEEY